METSHPHAQFIQQTYDAFGKGDMDTVGAAYTDDVVQHFPGQSPMGGDFEGKEALFEWYGRMFALTNGTFWIKPQTIVADDERAMALYQAGAERNGQAGEWSGVEVYALRDGKIADIWTIPLDQYVINDLWS